MQLGARHGYKQKNQLVGASAPWNTCERLQYGVCVGSANTAMLADSGQMLIEGERDQAGGQQTAGTPQKTPLHQIFLLPKKVVLTNLTLLLILIYARC